MYPESEIGRRIKEIRKSRKMTLASLSEKCGLSKGYLSKVENSDKAPPVSTLVNIANVLNVTISEIFGEAQGETSFSLVRKNERRFMARDGTRFGYSYETLAHNYPSKQMLPYILTIPSDIEQDPLFQHEGEEMLMVLNGRLRFIHGNHEAHLEAGDCIYFDSGVPHRGFAADGCEEVKCLIVIYKPAAIGK